MFKTLKIGLIVVFVIFFLLSSRSVSAQTTENLLTLLQKLQELSQVVSQLQSQLQAFILQTQSSNLLNNLATFTPTSSIVKERVKCVFNNATSTQSCWGYFVPATSTEKYSYVGRCSGVGTCVVNVSGEKGRKIMWRSTCEKSPYYTVIDGMDKYAEFYCPLPPKPPLPPTTTPTTTPSILEERVKCVFNNATSTQSCWGYFVPATSTEKYSYVGRCSGIGTCVVKVSGEKGRKIMWRSTCTEFPYYTVIDGMDKYAEFYCSAVKR